ncbi:uncharacterized protein BYT42DRAFT_568951 [Radiomyces spectabilis]|uniref:uncharacterized protein n=1 Tax=Radiomyces spectabilis TaxID=64574 RepID=UPI00221EAE03|nr:uncharacterized protein BYT42DRAFT_568951 [Radiomyces spectabilis]KAI8379481.1 hypothetical protein BYT42DRAFT_568951 [Radiomyces spectabilis]
MLSVRLSFIPFAASTKNSMDIDRASDLTVTPLDTDNMGYTNSWSCLSRTSVLTDHTETPVKPRKQHGWHIKSTDNKTRPPFRSQTATGTGNLHLVPLLSRMTRYFRKRAAPSDPMPSKRQRFCESTPVWFCQYSVMPVPSRELTMAVCMQRC